jgi:outer membrane protein OmpA-like peptidoglycan-associated protein
MARGPSATRKLATLRYRHAAAGRALATPGWRFHVQEPGMLRSTCVRLTVGLAVGWTVGCAATDQDETALQRATASPTPAVSSAEPAAARPMAAPPPPPAALEPAAATAVAVTSTAPLPLDALDAVVDRAAARLFQDALRGLGDAPRDVVIDPLIDANTGQQTLASVSVGAQLAQAIRQKVKTWTVRPFERKHLAATPLLLIGTLTPVALNEANESGHGPPDAFRLWLTLVDLRSGLIVAKRLDRATLASVNAEPTPFFRDSPTWHQDRTVAAYVKSCQVEARVGERIDPLYLWRLPAAALLGEAIGAYQDKQFAAARRLFVQASEIADPDDLRALSGRYLSSWMLGRKEEAAEEMKRIVAQGLAAKNLSLKVLFQPGTTVMLPDAELRERYRVWIRAVAREASSSKACVRVVGHASRGDSASASVELSQRRAATVRWLLARAAPGSDTRFTAHGVGWRDNLVGLGSDDQRDALDRRIEFRIVACP